MKNKIKDYKEIIFFYLLIILAIFLISTKNNNLNKNYEHLKNQTKFILNNWQNITKKS